MKQDEFINCRFIQPVSTDKKHIEPCIIMLPFSHLIGSGLYTMTIYLLLLYILLIPFAAPNCPYFSVCENNGKYIKRFKC